MAFIERSKIQKIQKTRGKKQGRHEAIKTRKNKAWETKRIGTEFL